MDNTIRIQILDPVDCKLNPAGKKRLKPILSYKSEWAKPGKWGGVKLQQFDKNVFDRAGIVGCGFLPRIREYCEARKIPLVITGELERIEPLEGTFDLTITLKPEQERLVSTAIAYQRGVIVGPTGIGKTVVMAGILGRFPTRKTLVLVPTIDLLYQTIEQLKKYGIHDLTILGDGHKLKPKARRLISTRQSYVKIKDDKWGEDLDVIVVDECHMAVGQEGTIDKIFRSTVAPVRIGLTATLPDPAATKMSLEGLFGPVIDEITFEEGQELGLLAEPLLRLIPVKYQSSRIEGFTGYDRIYEAVIVENGLRNRLIIKQARRIIDECGSVLIFISHIVHGQNLLALANSQGVSAQFVHGDAKLWPGEKRALLRKQIEAREVTCVISSIVWREGVNIPNLGGIVLAGGGKTEMGTLQAAGRGLRRVEGKDVAYIVDFLDPYPHVSYHCVERMKIYVEKGWIGAN